MIQMLFTFNGNGPMPFPPRSRGGIENTPDGDMVLSLAQAKDAFDVVEPTLRQLYSNMMGEVLSDDDAAAIGVAKPQPGTDPTDRYRISAADLATLHDNGMLPARPDHRALFLTLAERAKVNPLDKHIYWKYRNDPVRKAQVFSVELKIDGIRTIAQRTGNLAGTKGPRWSADGEKWLKGWPGKANPALARFQVLRRGRDNYAEAVANWESYVVTKVSEQSGEVIVDNFWQKMPDFMLGKCAEALAYRRAFPELLSGLYIEEEMNQIENPPRPSGESKTIRSSAGGYDDDVQVARDDLDSQLDSPPATAPSTAGAGMSDERLTQKLEQLGLTAEQQQRAITFYAGKYHLQYANNRPNFNATVWRMVSAVPKRWRGWPDERTAM